MGLEALPHLALGNTTKGMTQVVVGDTSQQYSYSDWLSDQAGNIKENAYQNQRYATAKYVQKMNDICRRSSVFSPTIKSLGYFSEIDNITGHNRSEQRLIPTKNPVAFGAVVYETTKSLLAALGADLRYYAPSEFVGLEMAEKGLLIKESLNINYSSNTCTQYADSYEAAFNELNTVFGEISALLDGLSNEALEIESDFVAEAVSEVIEAYNSSVRVSVEIGLSYTLIEDVWLNKKLPKSRPVGSKINDLYSYAERHRLTYATPYPNYKASAAESCMKEQVTRMSVEHYALYSEVFGEVRTKEVVASSGKSYQLGYIIPHMVYMSILTEDLKVFVSRLEMIESLEYLLEASA